MTTYPFAVRSTGPVWGEPGLCVWTSDASDGFYTSRWRLDDPVIRVYRPVRAGEQCRRFDGDRLSPAYTCVHETPVPLEVRDRPLVETFAWVRDALDTYARTELGVTTYAD